MSARKQWISAALQVKGRIIIDQGASDAIKKGNSVFQTLQSLGARMNATTWLDRTNYFAVLPSEHLETLIEIEADRMRNAYIKE